MACDAELCNGSTTASGAVCLGSNPSSAAIKGLRENLGGPFLYNQMVIIVFMSAAINFASEEIIKHRMASQS